MTDLDDNEEMEEFQVNERKPLEKLLLKKGKNEFIFDPENGGGRRRRVKKVSRLELLGYNQDCEQENQNLTLNHYNSEPAHNHFCTTSQRPLGVSESLYQPDAQAKLIPVIDDGRHPDLNAISYQTMSQLLTKKVHPLLVIDCRFDYEY